jgi:hypothetical protein
VEAEEPDAEDIQAKSQTLMEVSMKLGQAMYEQSQAENASDDGSEGGADERSSMQTSKRSRTTTITRSRPDLPSLKSRRAPQWAPFRFDLRVWKFETIPRWRRGGNWLSENGLRKEPTNALPERMLDRKTD